MRWAQFADTQNQLQGGGEVREGCYEKRCVDSLSHGLFALAFSINLVLWQ